MRFAFGQAREQPRCATSPDFRASRGVRRVHPSVLPGLSFTPMFLRGSETLGVLKEYVYERDYTFR